jgi:dCMP deaminase
MINNKQLLKDLYFLRIAKEVSKASKCMSRQIGSVLVKEGCIISTGYNGAASGIKHCNERPLSFYLKLDGEQFKDTDISIYRRDCPRKMLGYESGEGLHLCQASHSEANTIIQAAKNGICTLGSNLYCFCGEVCKNCAITIINAGIKELIYLKSDKVYDNYSGIILKESNIKIRLIDPNLI